MRDQISAILNKPKVAADNNFASTVFATLLDSNLPAKELSLTRLQNEATNIVGAGIETTKRALAVASFHILDNPAILTRLREELISAIPDPHTPPPLSVYEKLPYLSACIEESAFVFPTLRLPKVTNHSTNDSFPRPTRSVSPSLIVRCRPTDTPYFQDKNHQVPVICSSPRFRDLHVQLLRCP